MMILGQLKKRISKTHLKSLYIRSISQNNINNKRTTINEDFSNIENIPTQSRVVICGAGIIGCSVAFHLSKIKG